MLGFATRIPSFIGNALGGLHALYWKRATEIGRMKVEELAMFNNLPLNKLEVLTDDNVKLAAWHLPVPGSKKVVMIFSGRRSSRQGASQRAQFYIKRGYSVLLPDFRGTGDSEGKHHSMGWKERRDVIACYERLKSMGYKRIAAHGYSQGAAAISYSFKQVEDYDFVVLESCYSSFCDLVDNITRDKKLPGFVASPVKYWIEKITGVKLKILVPEEFVKHCKAPLLLLSGDSEMKVKTRDTLKIYRNSGAPFSKLHFFKGAKHENFMKRYRHEYLSIISRFLGRVELQYAPVAPKKKKPVQTESRLGRIKNKAIGLLRFLPFGGFGGMKPSV